VTCTEIFFKLLALSGLLISILLLSSSSFPFLLLFAYFISLIHLSTNITFRLHCASRWYSYDRVIQKSHNAFQTMKPNKSLPSSVHHCLILLLVYHSFKYTFYFFSTLTNSIHFQLHLGILLFFVIPVSSLISSGFICLLSSAKVHLS
jgi:hypothetical protein